MSLYHGAGGSISIHTLRVEGDLETATPAEIDSIFLSTPSVWRVTLRLGKNRRDDYISIHTLRVEGDLPVELKNSPANGISIHTLRVEGDLCRPGRWPAGEKISIHTLRVEGDLSKSKTIRTETDFYQHPPCGG